MDAPGAEFRTSDKILTVSNAISFLRLIFAIPTSIAIAKDQREVALVLMLAAYFSDLLDGYVARKTGTVSEWGKVIDPIADKIFVAVVVMVMFAEGMVPLWFLLPIALRDIVIFFGGIYVQRRLNVILPSNWWGKTTVLVISLTLFLSVLGVSHDILVFSMCISLALGAISLFVYGKRVAGLLKGSQIS